MIREQYVSFETAKLLKEKGFNEMTELAYGYEDGAVRNDLPVSYWRNSEIGDDRYSCPTQQMAMRWLREVHNLHVNVCPAVDGNYFAEKYRAYVDKLKERYPFQQYINDYDTPEEACEAAIKYCLENLI